MSDRQDELDLSKVKALQDAYLRYAEIPPVWIPETRNFERPWKPPQEDRQKFHFSPAFTEYARNTRKKRR
jgi:hypothetical protein